MVLLIVIGLIIQQGLPILLESKMGKPSSQPPIKTLPPKGRTIFGEISNEEHIRMFEFVYGKRSEVGVDTPYYNPNDIVKPIT